MAEKHMREIHSGVSLGTFPHGEMVVLDLDGVAAVNGSYLRLTALWLFTCGQLFASTVVERVTPRHEADPRPYDIYVCATGMNHDVKAEIVEFFRPRGLPLLSGNKMRNDLITEGAVLGHLDPALRATLNAVIKGVKVTAPLLHSEHPNEKITVTAWNNRLNDLYELRLVRKVRAGRTWEYHALAKELVWG